jgi:hypothetical protein
MPSGLQRKETLCSRIVRINDHDQGSEMKVRLFNHSTNTISPTDATQANGMESTAYCRRPGVLDSVRFHFMLDDYCDASEMKSMENRHLVI